MDENKLLREELAELRVLCNDVLCPGSVPFDERRVNLLKAQIYQLERQVLLLSDALGAKTTIFQELENSLLSVSDICREYIAAEVSGPDVPVKRCHLTAIVERLETSRVKLSKGTETIASGNLYKPFMIMNDYIKDGAQGQMTLLDVCSGEMQHLNLKRVAQLESRLCKLYASLHTLYESARVYTDSDSNCANPLLLDKHLRLDVHANHFNTQIQLSCALLKDCCEELLPLSLLYPAAPWSELRKPALRDVTTERVMSALPTLPRPKHTAVARVVDDMMKVTNHRLYVLNKQIENLKTELKFHQSAYTLQNKYTESLFKAVSEGYAQFETDLASVIHTPIKELVGAFDSLQASASQTDMRLLLETFQRHQTQLRTIKDDLDTTTEGSGTVQLTQFASQFHESINKLCQRCKKTKNREARDIEVLLDDQAHLESQLRDILAECDAKKDSAEKNLSQLNIEDGSGFGREDCACVDSVDKQSSVGGSIGRARKAKNEEKDVMNYRSNKAHSLRRESASSGRDKQKCGVTGKIGEKDMEGGDVGSDTSGGHVGVKMEGSGKKLPARRVPFK